MKPHLALCADSVHILAGDGRNVQANAISDGKSSPSGLVGTCGTGAAQGAK